MDLISTLKERDAANPALQQKIELNPDASPDGEGHQIFDMTIREPFKSDSTTTVPEEIPDMMRLRFGNFPGESSEPGNSHCYSRK